MIPELPSRDILNKENSVINRNNRDVSLQKNRRNDYLNTTPKKTRQNQSQEKKHVSFKKISEKISASDDNQLKNTVSNNGELTESQDPALSTFKRTNTNEVENQNVLANESIKNVKTMHSPKILVEDAIDIIKNSLLKISELLNLNITMDPAFTDNKSGSFTDHVIEQISEILYSLKSLTDLLDGAVKNHMFFDVKGILVNPENAAHLAQNLRSEIFNLEMAIKMAGVTEDVSRIVAEKMDKPFMNSSIPQAADPQSLSMSESQLGQLFNSQGDGNQKEMEAVIHRIIALVKEEASGNSKKKILAINGLKNGNNSILGNSLDHHSVNSQILRRLLKIDSDAGTQTHGKGPGMGTAGEENPKGITVLNILSSTKCAVGQNFADISTLVKDPSDALPGVDTSMKNQGQAPVDLANKLSSVNSRSLEESIITQVTQRFQGAVKNGIHEIRLVLRPDSLGDVRMTIQMEGDIVTARIQVENQQVKQIIESNLQNLKDSLEEQNLQAGSFDVNINRNSRDGEQNNDELAGNANSSEENGDKNTTASGDSEKRVGVNTGRRFGSNSIEYFA